MTILKVRIELLILILLLSFGVSGCMSKRRPTAGLPADTKSATSAPATNAPATSEVAAAPNPSINQPAVEAAATLPELISGKPIERELGAGKTDNFQLSLAANQFLH